MLPTDIPELPELPLEPDVPWEPAAPAAPSILIVQLAYVPLPTDITTLTDKLPFDAS